MMTKKGDDWLMKKCDQLTMINDGEWRGRALMITTKAGGVWRQCVRVACDHDKRETTMTNNKNDDWSWRDMTAARDDDEQQTNATKNNDDDEGWRRMTVTRDVNKRRRQKVTNKGDYYWQQKKTTIHSYWRWKTTVMNDAVFVSAKLWLIVMFPIAVFI